MKGIALFLILASVLNAQSLWQKTIVGMPLKQVQEIYPEAKLAPEGKDGPTLELATKINDHKFNVRLHFDKTGRLEMVRVSLDEQPNRGEAERIFQELIILLRVKYGKEIASVNGSDISTVVTWQTPEHSGVVLTWMSVASRNLMELEYSSALNRESDKM